MINEVRLPKGTEWLCHFRGWCLASIGKGISYWLEQGVAREVAAGSTLVFSSKAEGVLRASQLNEVEIVYFYVETEKLLGLLSLREQHFLKRTADQKSTALQVLSPSTRVYDQLKNICLNPASTKSSERLHLLQIFLSAFNWETDEKTSGTRVWADGRERFRQILNDMAVADFVELSISDLAPMMACSPRHVNRLFREELGASFREKQVELRLAKACELLTSSDAKVVDVALESGYQSSSVFSQLFKKHLGVSPGQWRRQQVKSSAGSPIHL